MKFMELTGATNHEKLLVNVADISVIYPTSIERHPTTRAAICLRSSEEDAYPWWVEESYESIRKALDNALWARGDSRTGVIVPQEEGSK